MHGGPLLATAHLARGAAALGDGRNGDAFRHLWPIFDVTHPAFHRFMRWSALLDLVEAAVGSRRAEQLADILAELEGIATGSGSPFLLAELLAARPLLANEDEAEGLFVAALGKDLRAYPFLQARTLFSFGRWLRRQRSLTSLSTSRGLPGFLKRILSNISQQMWTPSKREFCGRSSRASR